MTVPMGLRDWQELDRAHHLHPYCHARELNATGVRVIERGEGIYLWDVDGRRLLDGMAGLWCVNVGYGRGEIVDAAARQMDKLPYYNTFFGTATPPAIELSTTLSTMAPGDLNRAFFSNSGSEANDTVIKIVRYYWSLRGKPQKQTVIARDYGYHGSTLAAASLSHLAGMHQPFGLPIPGIEHIAAPYWYIHGGDSEPEDFILSTARALEQKILALGPDNVAAFIAEPLQGSGGLIPATQAYWKEIKRICAQYDVLLVADEVITGFGRTGHWFGSEIYDLKPDLMTLAKGLSSGYAAISCVMVSDRIARTIIDDGGYFNHGYTYSGHPVACAVSLKNLEILRREKLVDRVRDDIGPYFQVRLRELASHRLVGDVRGVGLMAGIELVADKAARRPFPVERLVGLTMHRLGFENGLIIRAIRDVMVLAPAFIITRQEVDELVGLVAKCLDLTAKELDL